MWVSKSPGDNEASLRREALGHAIFYVGFFAVFLLFGVKIGLGKGMVWRDPVPWSKFPTLMLYTLGLSVITLIPTYFWQKISIRSMRSRAFVCLGCGKDCNETTVASCKCGGPCVDLNHAKWVDTDQGK